MTSPNSTASDRAASSPEAADERVTAVAGQTVALPRGLIEDLLVAADLLSRRWKAQNAEVGRRLAAYVNELTAAPVASVAAPQAALASAPAGAGEGAGNTVYVEARQCYDCNHSGLNDAHATDATCSACEWSGPSPKEDKCPQCGAEGTMSAACPKCSSRYVLLASGDFAALAGEPAVAADEGLTGEIVAEVTRATRKFPTWPTDPLHAVAVLGEEFGELTKAMLQLTYEPHKASAEEVRTEAIQTAAMSLRLAMSLDRYEYRRCEQHKQGAASQDEQQEN